MNKALEALKRIRQETCPSTILPDFDKEECCNIIEKYLKALGIIKNKKVDVASFEYLQTDAHPLEVYNRYCRKEWKLTQEEYDLLKEVLL